MPVQPDVAEVLTDLAPVLDRWGRWYLFGAQAVVVYGVPRLSADVDVTVALQPEAPERFAQEMATAGFSLRVDDAAFIRRTRVMPFAHGRTGMPLDVVLAASGLEEAFLARAVPRDVGALEVPVIDPGDLVVAKILAARPKDIDDARGVWRAQAGAIDQGRVRAVLEQLEEALGQSDLVRALDAIAADRR